MDKIKKPSDREQFSFNIETETLAKLRKLSSDKGIPLNTYINILIDTSLQ